MLHAQPSGPKGAALCAQRPACGPGRARLHEALGVEAAGERDLAAQRVEVQRAAAALHAREHLRAKTGACVSDHGTVRVPTAHAACDMRDRSLCVAFGRSGDCGCSSWGMRIGAFVLESFNMVCREVRGLLEHPP